MLIFKVKQGWGGTVPYIMKIFKLLCDRLKDFVQNKCGSLCTAVVNLKITYQVCLFSKVRQKIVKLPVLSTSYLFRLF